MGYQIGDVVLANIKSNIKDSVVIAQGIIENENEYTVVIRVTQSEVSEMYNKTYEISKLNIRKKVEFGGLDKEGHIRNLIDIALTERDEKEFNRLSILLLGRQARDRLSDNYGVAM